jgi:deoxyribonuclease V
MWPSDIADLMALQSQLAAVRPAPRDVSTDVVAGCFVCFGRGGQGPGAAGDRGWAAAAVVSGAKTIAVSVAEGFSAGPYEPGLLAMREGPLLEAAVRSLGDMPPVLLVNATGRDHPRRAGLALHLGAALEVTTVGVTHRPLLAAGEWPGQERGATSPLLLDGDLVGYWVRTRRRARPLAVNAAWGTDPDLAVEIVLAATGRARTPEPIRAARRAARRARSEEA